MFAPDYGAASSHIKTLMSEREDFVAANRLQAARISELEAAVEAISTERDEATAESRAAALLVDRLATSNNEKEQTIEKLQTAAKADEVSSLCREGAGVLESLQDLLEEVSPRREAQANTVQYRPSVG
ncbi:hypothetical protein EMIHUDRAFT_251169 [Emiliania huxleyi CCMP1516]|uniref:Tubulin-specific chaperone A n=2 Tax=Emiliania huxleyi TaxID=2903 RepID=A0A0D3INQ5_EMIH1|nr:hypothetical protein EMIHUDRAFT_213127 [Emiliania huxleyi CCMP1516]XP_005792867.1 hypothetical protein EMIHUDRAFT_251169 [Emiliania huxleyi CCMP1516]EOD12890.1 hypothetical protein EMIHUDRAFT_213127 [Emiliania huxleyi CCMP1516]EOD40438.1 hypothetical protein EMIHUDRAFT_251169 [Emiliania huxleyi CCMP1516]|eukprot:XP_005765319.1 hypothetical protein EMIHUDRAFT_213127 [Emiliania huxleyi CCMP1516]